MVDARFRDGDPRCLQRVANDDGPRGIGRPGGDAGIEQQAVLVPGGVDRDPELAVFGQLPQGDLKVGLGSVSAFHAEQLGARNRGTQEQPVRNQVVGIPFRVAVVAPHAGEDRMVDAVVLPPPPDGVVALITLDEPVFRPHLEGIKVKRLGRLQLGNGELGGFQQIAVGPEDEIVGDRFRVDPGAEIEAEVLNRRLRLRINDRP